MEILRICESGKWTRFVRRSAMHPKELILEITDHLPDGRRFERRLVLEKQEERKSENTMEAFALVALLTFAA